MIDLDLSDDNDSFFDEPKATTKRSSFSKPADKNFISDLFSLSGKPSEKPDKNEEDNPLDILDPKTSTNEKTTEKKTKKISFEDDEDILGNLGLSKKPQENKKDSSKTDIFEDLLGTKSSKLPEQKKNPSLKDILKESQPTKPMTESSAFSLSTTASRGPGRRGRRPGLDDPLGLFESETAVNTKSSDTFEIETLHPVQSTSKTDSGPDLPDWLATEKSSKTESSFSHVTPKTAVIDQTAVSSHVVPKAESRLEPGVVDVLPSVGTDLGAFLQEQKLTRSDLETQNTFISLQQQESQLLMALQLKKYEESLSYIQRQQQEVLLKQEKQFNMLIDRHFSKQQTIENNMKLQQERINEHIKMLIAHVPTRKTEAEAEVMEKVETDKLKFHEDVVNSLKIRHGEEVFILEDSYKKQMSILEESMKNLEDRLKLEVTLTRENYEEKIKETVRDKQEEIEKLRQKNADLEEQYRLEIEKIRENYSREMEEIRKEHIRKIQMIKDVSSIENITVKDSGKFTEKISQSVEIFSENASTIHNLQEDLVGKYNVLSQARENSLVAKEKEIALMRENLEKCREAAETERSELMGLVRSLETKMAEQNVSAKEERWALQQAAMQLSARTAALDREFEFNKMSLEREREQIKTLKESLLAEQEKMTLQLTEEKLALAAEKSRVQTASQLNMNFDVQKSKAEVEAAIQIAREAAEMTDREREKLRKEKCEVEKIKRNLNDRERQLIKKEEDMQAIIEESERKIIEAETSLNESKKSESKYKDRLKDIQMQMYSLASREKKLAEEKIALSKERLFFQNSLKQNKKCGLCAVDDPPNLIISALNDTNIMYHDPYRLRFDLEEDKNSEVSKEEN